MLVLPYFMSTYLNTLKKKYSHLKDVRGQHPCFLSLCKSFLHMIHCIFGVCLQRVLQCTTMYRALNIFKRKTWIWNLKISVKRILFMKLINEVLSVFTSYTWHLHSKVFNNQNASWIGWRIQLDLNPPTIWNTDTCESHSIS